MALNGLSNEIRVCKSNEELMFAFEVFTLHAGHFFPIFLPHFFHIKNMLPNNLNKISIHILTLLLTFPISVLLESPNFTSGEYHQILSEKKGNLIRI